MDFEFTNAEKCKLADEIIERYYNKNFGRMAKSDFETLIFSEYIEHCINNNEAYDDYIVSKKLGITQQRVRTLKERKELQYPRKDFKWEDEWANAVKDAKFDKSGGNIKMIIEDVNVMNEVRHYIEQKGWYDDVTLNKKLLSIPLGCFVDICLKDTSMQGIFTAETKRKIKALRISDNSMVEFMEDFTQDGLKHFLGSATKSIALDVLKLMPFGGFAKLAIESLVGIIVDQ